MTKLLVRIWFGMSALPKPFFNVITSLLAALMASLFLVFAAGRRHIALTNLSLCFPKSTKAQRLLWTWQHIYYFLKTFFDRPWIWSGNVGLLKSQVIIENPERISEINQLGRPVIFLAPHFLGLDAAGSRLAAEFSMVTIYSPQKNRLIDQVIFEGRGRYGDAKLVSRKSGVRPLIKQIKAGRSLYYLPDMDFGPKDSVFAPFFGHQVATLPVVGRVAQMFDMPVVPVTTVYRGGRYYVTIHPVLDGLPATTDEEGAKIMNAFIEDEVEKNLTQYYWMHKRFKTRPQGESSVY